MGTNGVGKKLNSLFSIMLCTLMIFVMLCPIAAYAEESESKTVRIGWYQSYLFQDGMSDEECKSGYSYEYIHHIADYNAWNYEYVYGEWTDLFAKLKSGEIDILAGVSKTEERMEYLLYPNEIMGNENYVLYQHADDRDMDVSDIDSFKGKKIGAITDNLMTTCLENWLSENGAEAEIVYYDGFEERDSDFESNKIDAIVATDNNILLSDGYSQIVRVGKEAYYLAVTKERKDLLDDLNRAQGYIQDIDPYYLTNLDYQSYGITLANSSLSSVEKEWVDDHESITVGYLENYIPYSGTDSDGNAYGLITDVMDALIKELSIDEQLSISYKAYSNGDEMNEALKSGEIDTAFPVGGETWQLEQKGIKASNDLVTSNVNLVYKGEYSHEGIRTLAVTKGNTMMRDFLVTAYPDAEICEYESINACLDAVLEGNADATTVNSLRVDLVKRDRAYDSLSLMRMSKTSGRCMGVASDNTGLLMLLNRGIKLIGADFASNAAYIYMGDLYQVSVGDFIATHLGMVCGIVAIIILLILLVAVKLQNNTKAFLKMEEEKNGELLEKQMKLEEITSEQESQIEEITALNAELEVLKKTADEANQSKTNFLNNMSHDIRTPMNAIIGFTELMERKQDDPKTVSDYISKIKVSSEYLLSIINNVLDMARIESGKMSVDLSMVDLLGIETNAFSSIVDMARKKNQTFTMSNTIEHRYVLCDIAKQQEITMNLMSNAIKYTPEGGTIRVNIEELPCERPGYGKYCLTVSDNGIGMSKEFQEELFDSFTREKNTTESKVIGTGLGMAIVKKLVDIIGGTITVESEAGKGSTFKVTTEHEIIENPEDYLKGNDDQSVSEELLKGKRVLLAEDNDLNAEIATSVLEDKGMVVERASDGIECIDYLMKAEPEYFDVILMDIQMPNLNGYDTTRRIRALKDAGRASIPIVAMTANAFEEDKQNALASGMNGHLTKPIEIPKLMETLTDILAKEIDVNE